jgi:hypothetical protein
MMAALYGVLNIGSQLGEIFRPICKEKIFKKDSKRFKSQPNLTDKTREGIIPL